MFEPDTFDKQVVGVLMSDASDGAKKPLKCWSRTLDGAELNYDTTHHECPALLWAILFLSPHLEMKRFTILTDNDALMRIQPRWSYGMDGQVETPFIQNQIKSRRQSEEQKPGLAHLIPT